MWKSEKNCAIKIKKPEVVAAGGDEIELCDVKKTRFTFFLSCPEQAILIVVLLPGREAATSWKAWFVTSYVKFD